MLDFSGMIHRAELFAAGSGEAPPPLTRQVSGKDIFEGVFR